MGEKDDGLGLSLSLGCGNNNNRRNNIGSNHQQQQSSSMKLSLVQNKHNNNSMQLNIHRQKTHWNDIFQLSSDRRSSDAVSFLRGLDVIRAPVPISMVQCEEDQNGASSPNSTVSSLSGKRNERSEPAVAGEEDADAAAEGERDSCSRGSDDDDLAGDNCRKKLRLTKEQSLVLEDTFKDHNTLNPKQKLALAKQLNLRPRQVEVWFQNRRARTKLKQTEVDCEYLKRCCENLTDENRRLQKEVQELRALKLSPQLYMQMSPPTTLTMCPSCERVATTSSPSGSGLNPSARGPHCRPNNGPSWLTTPRA